MSHCTVRWALLCLAWFGVAQSLPSTVHAQNRKPNAQAQSRGNRTKNFTAPNIGHYPSPNFLIHTDLPAAEAQELSKRLETMLVHVEKYYEHKLRKTIELFVVKDINNWPADVLDPDGEASVRGGGGLTVSRTQFEVNRATGAERAVDSEAVVYAISDRGTPQHEAVHAYCVLTFGRTGPVWYSEGMAEIGQYWKEDERGVFCHDVVLRYLQRSDIKELTEVVDTSDRTGDSWQNYAWRWVLCHMLANNPNYAPRFKPLGLGMLNGDKTLSFERVYGPMAREINFEYHFLLQHIDKGIRADLVAWDWKAKFIKLKSSSPVTSKIDAQRGWQPARATLADGEEYEYAVTGTWKTGKEDDAVTADGSPSGTGRLLGVIFDDYQLSEPFELSTYGTFKPPSAGDLYVRCQDAWNELGDNSGKVTLKVKLKGKGNPLPMPTEGK